MLDGIIPILFTPFDAHGDIDAGGLRRIARFEIDGGAHAIGINGFASEAYKLTDGERERTVEIVASEMAGALPLVIGIGAGSEEAAVRQIQSFAHFQPAAYMVLPPTTMDNGSRAVVEFYVALGAISDAPVIVQQAPHIPAYRHTELSADELAEIADRADAVRYFKLEGPGSADKMAALAPMLADNVKMFGGGGGITALSELRQGAAGLIPGVGFNDIFLEAWAAWQAGDQDGAARVIQAGEALIKAVSGFGHETSLHIRKHLMKRAGYIDCAHVRRPTIAFDEAELHDLFAIVDALDIRIAQT